MKKTSPFLWVAIAALIAGFASGCSTPEARIRKNPEIFARLTLDQQEMIQHGQVGLGFDAEMVRLALGDPDRVRTRTDADGTSEIWSYVTYESADGDLLYRGWYHRNYWGSGRRYPYYLNYPARREREHFRVTFRAGRVVAIEEETRN